MKFSFIFLILVISSGNAWAQDCTGIEFPFLYFDGSSQPSIECTDVPYSHGSSEGETPWHIPNGTTINFCVDNSVSDDATSGCIDQSQLQTCADAAFSDWVGLCPGLDIAASDNSGFGPCGYTIYGSTDQSKFPPGTDADGAYEKTDVSQSNGIIDPNSSSSYLNFTGELELDGVTLTTCPTPSGCNDNGDKDVNACFFILHEIGHLFGLYDLSNFHCPNQCSDANNDVMWGQLPSDAEPCYSHGLSDCDKCYFKDLYCNASDGVKGVMPLGSTFDLGPSYPSPFVGQAQVEVTVSSPTYIHASLYDVLGRRVANVYNGLEQPGTNSLEVDGSKLAAGTYYLRVNTNQLVETIRIVRGGN